MVLGAHRNVTASLFLRNTPSFVDSEDSLPCVRQTAAGHDSDPCESNSHIHIPLTEYPSSTQT